MKKYPTQAYNKMHVTLCCNHCKGLATANRSRVRIRVTKMFGKGRWRCRPCENVPLI